MTMDTSEDVAHLLREKVRNNAFDLLSRLEDMEKRRSSGANEERKPDEAVIISPIASPTADLSAARDKTEAPLAAASALSHRVDTTLETDPNGMANKDNNNNNTTAPSSSPSWEEKKDDQDRHRRPSLQVALAASANASGTATPIHASTSTTTLAASASTSVNPSSNLNKASAPGASPTNSHQSLELSRRLQQLALERQKQSEQKRLRVIQADASSHLHSAKTFEELNLPDYLLQAIYQMGFDRPSAIQEETLPRLLDGRNVIAQAQSGSGKTAAFTIGMLFRCNAALPPTQCQALCVTPTRELAIQIVEKTVKPLSVNMKGLQIRLAISGEQVEKGTKVAAHVIVGTPGKVVDWIKRKVFDPKTVKVFVLDEADNMVQEKNVGGFRANSLQIKKQLPKNVQCLLFSATYTQEIIDFSTKLVKVADKILVEDGPEFLVLDEIKQVWIDTREYAGGSKIMFLADIYNLMTIGQSIVFVSSREEADLVNQTLSSAGYSCAALHSGMDSSERDETMAAFRAGKSTVLITTNVLARGVDVDNVCLVVNYNLPTYNSGLPDFETYLHRIGRTGRFGRKGTAVNLVGDDKQLETLRVITTHFAGRWEDQKMMTQIAADPEALADAIEF